MPSPGAATLISAGGLPLRVNFRWTLWGNIISAACQWGTLVVLAQMCAPDVVGRYALGLAIVSPVMMLMNLQLRSIQATDARKDFGIGDYLALKLVTTGAALIIIGCVLVALPVPALLFPLTCGLSLGKAAEAVSDVYYGLMQQNDRMDLIARSMIVRGVLSVAALAIGIKVTGNVVTGVFVVSALCVAVLTLHDVRAASAILARTRVPPSCPFTGPRWDVARLIKLARISLPLGLVMMLISLQTGIPRYFVENYAGASQVGVLAAVTYFASAANTVVDALGQAATPRLSRLFAHAEFGAFTTLLLQLGGAGAAVGLIGVVLAAAAGERILDLLYGPTYAAHSAVLLTIMAATACTFVASFCGYGLTAARMFRSQLPLSIASVLAVTCTCALWVPTDGLRGAANAILVGSIVRMTLSALLAGCAVTVFAKSQTK